MEKINCPNCGAPITGDKCEYCGTLFYDFANMEVGEVGYFRLKILDNLFIFRARVDSVDVVENEATLWADNNPYMAMSQSMPEINISLTVVKDDRGVIFEKRNKKLMEKASS